MANEKRLIDLDEAMQATHNEIWWTESQQAAVRSFLVKLPRVDAYTEEQVASILQQVKRLEISNQELETEYAWLKSCLNCKIRRECPRHCGKVVHGCDHWEYGDSMVHGQWRKTYTCSGERLWAYECDQCKAENHRGSYYCPNCGAKMDGDGNA